MSESPEQAAEPTHAAAHAGAHVGSHAAPRASHLTAHHADDRSRGDVPWRFAIAVLAAYVVVGALAGAVWEWVWTPPAQFVQQHQLYYVDYSALRRVFDGTGLYVLVAAIASALVALVVCVVTRRHELLTLGLVILGSVLAALVMRQVGYALGPPDPAIAAAHAADGTRLRDHLQVAGVTPLLVWPMTSLFMVALTFFAWPGHPRGPEWGDRARHRAGEAPEAH
ncbi:MAG: hypothetical protein WAV00_20100 [Nocardioides sp.]